MELPNSGVLDTHIPNFGVFGHPLDPQWLCVTAHGPVNRRQCNNIIFYTIQYMQLSHTLASQQTSCWHLGKTNLYLVTASREKLEWQQIC